MFNNMGHHINMPLLKEMYRQLERKKAVGIDGETKASYGVHLEDNLMALYNVFVEAHIEPKPSRIVKYQKKMEAQDR